MSDDTTNLSKPSLALGIFLIGCFAFLVGFFFGRMPSLNRPLPPVVVSAGTEQAWWMLPQKEAEDFIINELIDARKVIVRWRGAEWNYSAEITNRDRLRELGDAFYLKEHLRPYGPPTYSGPIYYVEVAGSRQFLLYVYGDSKSSFAPWVAFGPTFGKQHPDHNDERWWSMAPVSAEFLAEIERVTKPSKVPPKKPGAVAQ